MNDPSANPFDMGNMMYRTGDVGKWLENGNLEFLGRNDDQVKIRGHRIELGEIETQLVRHPGVEASVVVARNLQGDTKELVAYVVGETTVISLREHLATTLPHYMIPAYFVPLEKLPLTPNGKIDKKALPNPDQTSFRLGSEYEAPRNALEEKLVQHWQDLFNKKKIGIYDNYFALGGDSIKAIQVVSRLQQDRLNLQTRDIFQYPTIAKLATKIVALNKEINALTKTKTPLTQAQKEPREQALPDMTHCQQQTTELTPADLTYSGLSMDDLDDIFA